jgi:hypothetical protein
MRRLFGEGRTAVHSYPHQAASLPQRERSAGISLGWEHTLHVAPRHVARLPNLHLEVGVESDGFACSHVATLPARTEMKQDAGS